MNGSIMPLRVQVVYGVFIIKQVTSQKVVLSAVAFLAFALSSHTAQAYSARVTQRQAVVLRI